MRLLPIPTRLSSLCVRVRPTGVHRGDTNQLRLADGGPHHRLYTANRAPIGAGERQQPAATRPIQGGTRPGRENMGAHEPPPLEPAQRAGTPTAQLGLPRRHRHVGRPSRQASPTSRPTDGDDRGQDAAQHWHMCRERRLH